MRRRRISLAVSVVAVAMLAAACFPPPPPPPTPTILYFTDSLGDEAHPRFAADFGPYGYEVVKRSLGGTALCDWFESITTELKRYTPAAVVLQFSGNQITPCIAGAPDVPARYAADLHHAFDLLAGVPAARIFVVAAPVTNGGDPTALNAALQPVTTSRGGTWVPGAAAAVLDGGSFAWELPCLPDETPAIGCRVDGLIEVRSADGGHFCPVRPPATCPPVYSSGARRFADGMAAPIKAALGLPPG